MQFLATSQRSIPRRTLPELKRNQIVSPVQHLLDSIWTIHYWHVGIGKDYCNVRGEQLLQLITIYSGAHIKSGLLKALGVTLPQFGAIFQENNLRPRQYALWFWLVALLLALGVHLRSLQ